MKKQQNVSSFSESKSKQEEKSTHISKCIQCGTQANVLTICEGKKQMCKKCYSTLNDDEDYFQNVKFSKEKSVNFIIQGLFLGNQAAATDQQTFDKNKISAVLVCGRHLMTPFSDKFQYKRFNIGDSRNQKILPLFDQSHQWIKQMHKKNKNLLVHCAQGVSRSASFTIAYMMKQHKMTFLKAFDYVKQKRQKINPNPGFVKQLLQYQKNLLQGVQIQKQKGSGKDQEKLNFVTKNC